MPKTMKGSPKIEFEENELWRIADALLLRINNNKNHLKVWEELQKVDEPDFTSEDIKSNINYYTNQVNGSITIRHKVLAALGQPPHPELIGKEVQP